MKLFRCGFMDGSHALWFSFLRVFFLRGNSVGVNVSELHRPFPPSLSLVEWFYCTEPLEGATLGDFVLNYFLRFLVIFLALTLIHRSSCQSEAVSRATLSCKYNRKGELYAT